MGGRGGERGEKKGADKSYKWSFQTKNRKTCITNTKGDKDRTKFFVSNQWLNQNKNELENLMTIRLFK